MTTPEHRRLAAGGRWRKWGPYVSERAWGTVREDYSEHGEAWEHFPHDQARSRAFRWSEDGLGAVCDRAQRLCLGFAFWNGRDPVLKERIFGLTGNEGNHGEDAKEYWWYLDSTPTHSFMRWRYFYPHQEFPYAELVAENRRRGRLDPEYELVDTGTFDGDRYWDITVDYAKAAPDDLCVVLRAANAGPEAASLDVLPTLWFRNTWAWGRDDRRPSLIGKDGRVVAEHHSLGRMVLAGDGRPELLFCENDSNARRLWGLDGPAPYPKDGINDHVVHGAATVNPGGFGTKAALRYRLSVPAGATREIRLRLSPEGGDLGAGLARVMKQRAREADQFYATLTPADATPDEAMVMRQAFAGLLWSKQFFHYDVEHWLDG
ncbi:MAG: MGH1-like glycoside hydrolase domain-containing protein, partial [Acidimicrobiales bacterium]